MITEIAPAKINLYLHVGAVRADGLHDLASLMAFAATGDVVRAEPAPGGEITLEIIGPFAGPLKAFPTRDNLVFRAAVMLREACGLRANTHFGARLLLDKRLPVAAGVGGGSADAAAALRALIALWNLDGEIDAGRLRRLAFALGADVPACLESSPVLVTGAGERLRPARRLPPLWAALVNPRVETPTGPVFRAFDAATPAPALQSPLLAVEPTAPTYEAVAVLMAATRNDLQTPAIARAPVIAETLKLLDAAPGRLGPARMSGSGATTFALFSSAAAAERAAAAARARGWWAASGALCAG